MKKEFKNLPYIISKNPKTISLKKISHDKILIEEADGNSFTELRNAEFDKV